MSQVKVIKIKNYRRDVERIFSELDFRIKPAEKILIKPNLVMPRQADTGVTTSLELISALIEVIKERGAIPILAEGVGYEFTSQTFSVLGIDEFVKKHGIEFVDCRNCPTFLKKIELPEVLQSVDKIINLPKLKTHVLTGISGGMKNLMGLLPLSERRKMHIRGLAKSIVELNLKIPTDLTIIDASVIMSGQGPAFGDKINLGYLLASKNVFVADFAAAKFLNIDPEEIGHLKCALKRGLVPKNIKAESVPENISIVVPENKLYIFIYWCLYLFDHLQAKISRRTLIPWFHWHFGARPEFNLEKCHSFQDCRKCIGACPIKAISKEHGIDFKKCAKVRCLKCFDICPHGVVTIRGISKPSYK